MTPNSEAELAEMVAQAAAAGTRLRLKGGGTRLPLGNVVTSDDVLHTRGVSGINLYEPGALTIVAAAGTPLDEVRNTLAEAGQQLPFEPMDHRGLFASKGAPTIGSVVACNISGPRRIQAGACRDSLIGVRFVDGQGTILKNGGRVMKNVTGYDLVKLMAGAYGTLGVLTEVAFKVLPKPETMATITIAGLDTVDAVAAMSAALGSPYDVTGAAHMSIGVDGHPQTMIRVEGFEASVKYRCMQLRELLARFGDVSVQDDADQVTADWANIRDVKILQGQVGDLWRISVKPSDAPAVVKNMDLAGIINSTQLDWGGGLIWVLVPEQSDIRATLAGIGGHATLIRGAGDAFHPQPAPIARIEADLRAKFDPKGILNPGIMGV